MAITINSEIEAKRDNIFNVNPDHIMVVPEDNGRPFGLDPDKVVELAYKMLRDGGQKTPGKARRIEENRLRLTAGNYRHAALSYINAHRLSEKPWFFRVEIVDQNAEKAFLENIIENRDRTQVSIIGDAKNIDRLATQFGYTDERICEFYGTADGNGKKPMSPAWLGQMRLLLRLSEAHQRLIDSGAISVTIGRRLAELPEGERDAYLALAQADAGEGKKITEQNLLKVGRAVRMANGSGMKSTALKMPEVKKVFSYLASEEAKMPPKLQQFAALFEKYQSDKLAEIDFIQAAKKLFA